MKQIKTQAMLDVIVLVSFLSSAGLINFQSSQNKYGNEIINLSVHAVVIAGINGPLMVLPINFISTGGMQSESSRWNSFPRLQSAVYDINSFLAGLYTMFSKIQSL